MTQRQAVNAEDEEGLQRRGEQTYYVYDTAGQRVRKVTENAGTKKNERIYLGELELYREHTGKNAGLVRETLNIMDDKQRIALVETRNNVDDASPTQLIRFQFNNHLGTATLELNQQARVISYEEFSPYGSTTYQAVDKTINAPAKRYRYTGKERDEESGLYYHGARYYAPWVGRWTSCDPGGMIDGANRYSYAQQHPIHNVDRSGLQSSPASISDDPCPHGCIGPARSDSATVQQSFIVYQHKLASGEIAADVPFSDYYLATTGGPAFPR